MKQPKKKPTKRPKMSPKFEVSNVKKAKTEKPKVKKTEMTDDEFVNMFDPDFLKELESYLYERNLYTGKISKKNITDYVFKCI